MKIITFLLLLLHIPFSMNAQNPLADELITVHTVANLTEMNTIQSPNEGSLVFNMDDQHTYQFNGFEWQKLIVEKEIVKPLTTSYTLTGEDDRCALTFNSSTNIILTVPQGLPVGYNVSIYQTGTGKITIVGSGVTIKNRLMRFTTAGLDASVGILSTSSDIFHISGDLKR